MNVNLKWVSLIVLIIHNSFSVFVIRYSRTLPDKYISSTAVVCSELIKFSTAIFMHVHYRLNEKK